MSEKQSKHIIRRNVFEISIDSRGDANRMQNEISRLFSMRVSKLLDEIFNEIADPDYTYRIDLLELDLGTIEERYLERQITERLEKQLKEKLKDLIGLKNFDLDVKRTNLEVRSLKRSEMDSVMYFLENGYLSSWTSREASLEELILRLIEKDPSEFKRRLLKIAKKPSVVERIQRQFSANTVVKIISIMAPTQAMSIGTYARALAMKFNKSSAISGLSSDKFKSLVRESILHFILVERSVSFDRKSFEQSIEQQLEKKTNRSIAELIEPEKLKSNTQQKELEEYTATRLGEVLEVTKILLAPEWTPPKTAVAKKKLTEVALRVLGGRSWKLKESLVQAKVRNWKKLFTRLEEIVGKKNKKEVQLFKQFFVETSPEEKQEELAKLLEIAKPEPKEPPKKKLSKEQEKAAQKQREFARKQQLAERKLKQEAKEIFEILKKSGSRISAADKVKLKEKLSAILENKTEQLAQEILEMIFKEIAAKKITKKKDAKESIEQLRKKEITKQVEAILKKIEQILPKAESPRSKELMDIIRKEQIWKRPNTEETGVQEQGKEDEQTIRLDFVRYYLEESKSPWWAEGEIRESLESVTLKLLKESPRKLTDVLQQIIKESTKSKRTTVVKNLLKEFSTSGVQQIVEAIEPDFIGFILTEVLMVEKLIAKQDDLGISIPSSSKKRLMWEPVLQYVFIEQGANFDVQQFVKITIKEIAGQLRIKSGNLVQKLKTIVNNAVQAGELRFSPLENMINSLLINPAELLPDIPIEELDKKEKEIKDALAKEKAQTNVPELEQPDENVETKEAKEVAETKEAQAKEEAKTKEESQIIEEAQTEEEKQIKEDAQAKEEEQMKEDAQAKEEERRKEAKDDPTPAEQSGRVGDPKTEDTQTTKEGEDTKTTKREESPIDLPENQPPRERTETEEDQTTQDENVDITIEEAITIIEYFLSKGSLPRKIAHYNIQQFEELFTFALAEKPLTVRDLVARWGRAKQTRIQMAKQFSTPLLLKIVKRMQPSSPKLLRFVENFLEVIERTSNQKVKDGAREFILYYSLTKSDAFDGYTFYKALVKHIAREKSVLVKSLLQDINKAIKPKSKAIEEDFSQLTILLIKEFDQKPPQIMAMPSTPDPAAEPSVIKEEDAIFVHNAGIVLMRPSIGLFFNALKMLTPTKKFKTTEMAYRAVHLLEYVATKRQGTPEHLLSLLKIMCGVPFGAPIEKDVVLTDYEKEVSDYLISQLLLDWPMMKNTSPDGMRGSFLIRDGRLTKKEKSWRLVVEKKAFDMVMSSYPWSFSIIRFPWMAESTRIFVEWGDQKI